MAHFSGYTLLLGQSCFFPKEQLTISSSSSSFRCGLIFSKFEKSIIQLTAFCNLTASQSHSQGLKNSEVQNSEVQTEPALIAEKFSPAGVFIHLYLVSNCIFSSQWGPDLWPPSCLWAWFLLLLNYSHSTFNTELLHCCSWFSLCHRWLSLTLQAFCVEFCTDNGAIWSFSSSLNE